MPKRGIGDSPIREGASSHGIGMETTASDHNSARRAVTVWDLQMNKERKARERRSSSVRTPTAVYSSDGDRFGMSLYHPRASMSQEHITYPPGYTTRSRSSREFGGNLSRGYTPKSSQALIPSWSTSQPILTRSNSITRTTSLSRSSSFVLTSPCARTRSSPCDDCISDIGGGTPRHSTGSQNIHNFKHVRIANSYPITSENGGSSQPLRYGSRRTADYYPSRSTRW
jgi:hypothetical protein